MNLYRKIISRLLYPYDAFRYDIYMTGGRRKSALAKISCIKPEKRVMVLSPHQDDEVLGCGGYLLSVAPSTVKKVVFTTDGAGRRDRRSKRQRQALVHIRREEAKLVSSLLGAEVPVFLDFPDGDLCHELKSLCILIAYEIEGFKPDLIMLPFPTDPHPDHVATSLALIGVTQKLLQSIDICFYHVHAQIPDQFITNYYGLDKTTHTKKMELLRKYSSQSLDFQHEILRHTILSRKQALLFPKRKYCSVEFFSCMTYKQFVALDQLNDFRKFFDSVRPLTYAPYSFRNYMRNQLLFERLESVQQIGSRQSCCGDSMVRPDTDNEE